MGIFSIFKRTTIDKREIIAQKNILSNQVGLDTNYIKFISEGDLPFTGLISNGRRNLSQLSTDMRWRRLCVDLTFYLDCSFNTLSIFGLASRWGRSKGNAVAMTQ